MTQKIDTLPSPQEIAKQLRTGDCTAFGQLQIEESYLAEIAEVARKAGYLDVIVADLMSRLSMRQSRAFDWNTGSLIQHAEPEDVFSNIPTTPPQRESLYESIGLTWCLGEFGRRDPRVVSFLEDAVTRARRSASWLRAAQSLEKLELVDAISYLKASLRAQGVLELNSCLENLADARHRIGVLLHTTVDTLQDPILPRLREILCTDNFDGFQKLGAAWLAGRFRFADPDVEEALMQLAQSDRYELRFYSLQALKEIGSKRFIPLLLEFLDHADPLLRKMAIAGLSHFDSPRVRIAVEEKMFSETHPDVLGALTRCLYTMSHHAHQREREAENRIGANENGMIVDEGDKWYINPDVYHIFSQAQDPKNLAFSICLRSIERSNVRNPVDLGSGTGRFTSLLLESLSFDGLLYALDASEEMTKFLGARLRREGIPKSRFRVVHGRIEEAENLIGRDMSNLVIANFAFPSKSTDRDVALRELRAVHSILCAGGHLLTVGWDETFNDELSEMWYKYIPDGITARNFEEWRRIRAHAIISPRNCGLTWLKTGLRLPVEFSNEGEAARVMGYLFGRGAAHEILKVKKNRWMMSIGVTLDSKEEIQMTLRSEGLL